MPDDTAHEPSTDEPSAHQPPADQPSAHQPPADELSATGASTEHAGATSWRAMGGRGSSSSSRLAASAGLWVLGAGYAWVMGASRPFTVAADTETAVAFVIVIGAAWAANVLGAYRGRSAVVVSVGPARSSTTGIARAGAGGMGDGSRARAGAGGLDDRSRARLWPWVVVLGTALAWELFCYFAGFNGHRAAFPTISSLEAALGHWQAGRAAVVLAWMAFGWRLVRR